MKVINGVGDFEKIISKDVLAHRRREWDDWYWHKYKKVLQHQCDTLYHQDKEVYHQFLNQVDTDYYRGLVRQITPEVIKNIEDAVTRAALALEYSQDFEVYLMLGFGHVLGTSCGKHKPFVYFGLELLLHDQVDMEYVIAHEVNHMVRLSHVRKYRKSKGMDHLTFGDVLVLEGLGVVNGVMYVESSPKAGMSDNKSQAKKKMLDIDAFRKSLMIHDEAFTRIKAREEEWIDLLLDKIDEPMTTKDWYDYFVINNQVDDQVKPTGIGYYVGGRLISSLVAKGLKINELTRMDTGKILQYI